MSLIFSTSIFFSAHYLLRISVLSFAVSTVIGGSLSRSSCCTSLLFSSSAVLLVVSRFIWPPAPISTFSSLLFLRWWCGYSGSVKIWIRVVLISYFREKERRWNHVLRVNFFFADPSHDYNAQVLCIASRGSYENIWRRCRQLRLYWCGNVLKKWFFCIATINTTTPANVSTCHVKWILGCAAWSTFVLSSNVIRSVTHRNRMVRYTFSKNGLDK